jgi:hypothetical protein
MIVWLLDKQNTLIFPEIVEFFKNNQIWTKACITSEHYVVSPIQNLTTINEFWDKLRSPVNTRIELDIDTIINQKKDCEYAHEPYLSLYNVTQEEANKKYQDELKEWKVQVDNLKQQIKLEYIEKWNGLRDDYRLGYTHKLERDVSISSEVPIMGYNKFIIGYWDVVINFQIPHYKTKNFMFWHGKQNEDNDLYQVVHARGMNVAEFIIKPIFIEVKPIIRSFGETLRQLKTYQSFVPDSIGRTYLFTTDVKFKAAFETQGIKVMEYKSDLSFNAV